MFYVYKITNRENGKMYIGKTRNVEKRWYQHVYDSKRNPTYFGRAICKYGESTFDIEEIDSHENEDVAYSLEKRWIEKLDSRNPDIGYNLAEGGRGGFCGVIPINESRKKMSNSSKSRKRKPHTEEAKKKVKEARSKQNRKLLDIDLKNEILFMYRTNNYTKQQVADRFNIKLSTVKSVIRQGSGLDKFEPYKMPEERKKRISESLKAKKLTDEKITQLNNARAKRVYKPLSDEQRAKISSSLRKRSSITDDVRKAIRSDYQSGQFTKKKLAEKYGITYDSAVYILRNDSPNN
jgi:predicted GIY-YIG superfamily endonuclease/DNA-binding MarR family transcriptional regulator